MSAQEYRIEWTGNIKVYVPIKPMPRWWQEHLERLDRLKEPRLVAAPQPQPVKP